MSRPRTRMALLAGRAQLSLAMQGQALLEQKRDALLRELYREVRVVDTAREELDQAAAAARIALEEARILPGPEPVAAAAIAAQQEATVELVAASVMGVPVPAVAPRSMRRTVAVRGRGGLPGDPALELVAERFEDELTLAVHLATIEARVRRLAAEIRRTSSRVNALRMRVVPRLEADTRAIELALLQREREDQFRLKRVKDRRARRTGARGAPGPTAADTSGVGAA